MWGGRTLAFGASPMASSSLRYGLHQLFNVVRLTPALAAKADFDIAFIVQTNNLRYLFSVPSAPLWHVALRA